MGRVEVFTVKMDEITVIPAATDKDPLLIHHPFIITAKMSIINITLTTTPPTAATSSYI